MISLAGRVRRLWLRFWFDPADLVALAVFRIGLGSLWIVILLISYPNWLRFYGPDGVIPLWLITADPYFDGGRLSLFFHTRSDFTTMLVFWFALASAVAFTVGWKTRIATVCLYAVVISMTNRAPSIVHGEDQITRPLLFLACFAPLGARLSLDAWRRRDIVVASRWSQRLLQITVAAVYLFSMPAKPADDRAWIDGTAVYYVMASGNWARFPELAQPFYSGIVSALATYGTLLVEGAFVVLAWWGRTRLFAIGALAFLHLVLAVILLNVVFFNLAMVVALTLFVPGTVVTEWSRRGWAAADALRARLRGSAKLVRPVGQLVLPEEARPVEGRVARR